MNYLNEFDPKAAAWLEELIEHESLPPGIVDRRCVSEVTPADVAAHDQCHFFAGIGGWPLALDMAGWPRDRPVWTASLPCQPFSNAGKQKGTDDDRHLWPTFRDLIEQCRPAVMFGEQIASPPGRAWLAAVQTDLEALGYSTAAADLCAAGVGGPHVRQRLYWCAIRMGDADGRRWSAGEHTPKKLGTGSSAESAGHPVGVGDANIKRLERSSVLPERRNKLPAWPTGVADQWGGTEPVRCADGKYRPAKPGIQPLAGRVPGRVGLLRGYGNAIVPQVAATFIMSVMDCMVMRGAA